MLCGDTLLNWSRLVELVSLSRTNFLPIFILPNPIDNGYFMLRHPGSHLHFISIYRNAVMTEGRRRHKLTAWLQSARSFECSDPRDRIFAFLGLSGDAEMLGMLPDYEKSCERLYIEFAVSILKAYPYLRLLCYASCCRRLDLPSWVPDWSINPSFGEGRFIVEQHRTDSVSTRSSLLFSADLTKLTISSITLDSIKEIWSWIVPFRSASLVTVLEVLWKLKRFPRYSQSGSAFAALWRTLIANSTTATEGKVGEEFGSYFVHVLAIMTDTLLHNEFRRQLGISDAIRQKSSLYTYHSFIFGQEQNICLAESGYLCLAPKEAQEGDVITIFANAVTPFILRSTKSTTDEYELVGPIYVHDVMDAIMDKPGIESLFRPITLI